MMSPQFTSTGKHPRGYPRIPYERTYILMPNFTHPEQDHELDEWYRVLVESGLLVVKRYTVGCSADDAAIGDLSVRRVVALCPETWGNGDPSLLRQFYEHYYPGVEYHDIGVDTPAAFKRWCEEMRNR